MIALALTAGVLTAPAAAHHSYNGFDRSKSQTVAATVAAVDWNNPHINVWVWVPNDHMPAGHDVYALQAGGVLMMSRFRWTKSTFQIGEKITVTFFPLLDGRPGGAFIKARHADGSWTTGDLAGVNYFSR